MHPDEREHRGCHPAVDPERGAEKSICPSEVPHALVGDAWRSLVQRLRTEAATLARDGKVAIMGNDMPIVP